LGFVRLRSSGSVGNDRKRLLLLLLLQLGLFFTDLLHLEHPLHDELVLALLEGVALVLALPGEVQLSLPALVERDQQVGALVSVRKRDPGLHHLSLRCYHLLRRSFHFHGFAKWLRFALGAFSQRVCVGDNG
jgi:hypothetical protein